MIGKRLIDVDILTTSFTPSFWTLPLLFYGLSEGASVTYSSVETPSVDLLHIASRLSTSLPPPGGLSKTEQEDNLYHLCLRQGPEYPITAVTGSIRARYADLVMDLGMGDRIVAL